MARSGLRRRRRRRLALARRLRPRLAVGVAVARALDAHGQREFDHLAAVLALAAAGRHFGQFGTLQPRRAPARLRSSSATRSCDWA